VRVVGIDHIQLAMPVGGEERARGFYRDLLQLPEKEKPPHLVTRGGVWFERGGLKVHLGADKEFRPARKAHPGLLVQGLATLADRLRRAGHPVIEDEPLPGYRHIYTEDPFGNRIELLEPDTAR